MRMPRRARANPLDRRLDAEVRRAGLMAAVALALAHSAPAGPAADTSGYAGAAACRKCHPAEYETQSQSAHAKSLSKASDHALARYFAPPEPLFRPPRYRFDFSVRDG